MMNISSNVTSDPYTRDQPFSQCLNLIGGTVVYRENQIIKVLFLYCYILCAVLFQV